MANKEEIKKEEIKKEEIKKEEINKKSIKDYDMLVFSGGGINGYVFSGILKYLGEKNIYFKKFAGTSIGSLYATLLALKIPYLDIIKVLHIFNYEDHHNIDIINLFTDFGLDNFLNIEKFIKNIFLKYTTYKDLNKITFKNLYEYTGNLLIINAVNIISNKVEYFSHIDTPNMSIIDAIKASMCIPIIFKPITYENKLYVDGGLLENCIFNYSNISTYKPLFLNIKVMKSNEEQINYKDIIDNTDFFSYIKLIMMSIMNNIFDQQISNEDIINIYISNERNIFTLDIDSKDKEILYALGYQSIDNYFK